MIICSSSNIDLIQGVSGYGTAADGATDWRIENTATGVFNILNSPNLLTPNVSIIDTGNIGIGTIPVSGTNKLQVQGNLNVSGGYFVAGVAFKPATAVLADTATALATSRNINGVAFNGTGNIDITLPYFNLTNKITAGNGISLTTGSVSTSPSISTNLTAGNGITISAAASPVIASSQWVTTGGNIYYNSGNVGIGTNTVNSGVALDVNGSLLIRAAFDGSAGGTKGIFFRDGFTDFKYNCSILTFDHSGDNVCDGLSINGGDGVSFCTGSNTRQERMRITNTGNVGIGTNNPSSLLHVNGVIRLGAGAWHLDTSSNDRFYFDTSDKVIYIKGGANTLTIFKNSSDADTFHIFGNGNYSARGSNQAWSDSRIKKDIFDINDDTALQSILSIEPKTYKYIDGSKSTERVYGFIAQQIREVIPEAVVLTDNIIPNVYKNCICEDNKRIYIVLPQEVLGSLVRIGNGGSYKIILVESDYIEVEKYMESKDIPDGEQFVYGYEVKDFHTINKEYIFTLNVCATQELHRRIEAQGVVIKSYEDRIKDLETKVERLINSMNA